MQRERRETAPTREEQKGDVGLCACVWEKDRETLGLCVCVWENGEGGEEELREESQKSGGREKVRERDCMRVR